MDNKSLPVLHLLVGINGAGKTTFYYNRIKPHAQVPFINADEIQKQRWPDETNNPQRSYEAAKIAEQQRDKHIAEGNSFAAETVFSHPSKLDLIKKRPTEWLFSSSVSYPCRFARAGNKARRGSNRNGWLLCTRGENIFTLFTYACAPS